ncbi:hypothetical protein SMC26_22590 [Actinomadura fulvescens]|uniref:Integral membrane protein n=1 Tax=Actinomadura fulvescens TaxID=46160 RepID=A0ABP6D655_9ACTN
MLVVPDGSPVFRLLVVEGVGTLLFAVLTLPVTMPGRARVPEWVQVLGLMLLIAMLAAAIRTWRRVIASGLRPARAGIARPGAAVHGLRRQAAIERRTRVLLALYLAAPVVLVPIPDTWTAFWFGLTLAAAATSSFSLAWLAAARLRAHRAAP